MKAVKEPRNGDAITIGQVRTVAEMVRTVGGFDRFNELLGVVREVGGLAAHEGSAWMPCRQPRRAKSRREPPPRRPPKPWIHRQGFFVGSGTDAFLLLLRGTAHALCRRRDGFEAGLGDLHAAGLALTVAAVLDPLEGRFNLVESVLVAPQQTQPHQVSAMAS